jgi:hypothetical protein
MCIQDYFHFSCRHTLPLAPTLITCANPDINNSPDGEHHVIEHLVIMRIQFECDICLLAQLPTNPRAAELLAHWRHVVEEMNGGTGSWRDQELQELERQKLMLRRNVSHTEHIEQSNTERGGRICTGVVVGSDEWREMGNDERTQSDFRVAVVPERNDRRGPRANHEETSERQDSDEVAETNSDVFGEA